MKNVTELLAFYALPININKHPLGNIFTSKNKSIPKSFFTMPKKSSLSTSNP